MLEMTKMDLELISDNDMLLFVKKGMGRGISYDDKNQANILCILTQIIYMFGWWVNIYLILDLNS